MNNNELKKLILAAGGTGGHIWPALSFGRWISENHPECTVQYVCGSRPLELEIYNAAGVSPFVLPIEGSPLSGNMVKKFSRLRGIVSSFRRAGKDVMAFEPDAALLFGGYLSFPMILSCRRHKVRCIMHEQNAYAGKVTRYAAKKKIPVLSGWNECAPLKADEYKYIGIPVRKFDIAERGDAWRTMGLEGAVPTGKIAVVFTGSLGSASVKNIICGLSGTENFKNWTFLLPAAAKKIETPQKNVVLLPRIWNTGLLYSLADILILRAGGSTLAEAGELGIPSVVIPWSKAADNHQARNAARFVKENSGVLVKENEAENKLADALLQLSENGVRKNGALCGKRDAVCASLWESIYNYRL